MSLGTLDGDKMRALVDGGADAFIVKLSVRKQIHLTVGNAVLGERSLGRPDADDLLQRIVWLADRG